MTYIIIAILLFLLDYTIKFQIVKKYDVNQTSLILKNRILLCHTKNYGAILNLGARRPFAIRAASAATLVLTWTTFISILQHSKTRGLKVGFSLIMAGGLSNTFDRLINGNVTDYFSFLTKKPSRLSKIVFNLGDIFIFIGTFISIISCLFDKDFT